MAVSAPRVGPFPGNVPARLLLLGLAAAVAVGGSYLVIAGNPLNRNQQAPTYQTAQVSQGNLQVTVAATGPITNPASVPLSFKSSGKLAEVDVSVGQHVTAGQALAKLDTTDLQIAVDQAKAALVQQQASLATTTAGVTPEQQALTQAQVDAAQTSLDNAQKALASTQQNSAATIAASQGDVTTAQTSLANAQKALQNTQDQAAGALQADQTALMNAQQAYQDQFKTFHGNWDSVQAAIAQQQTAVDNAQKALDDSKASPGRIAALDRPGEPGRRRLSADGARRTQERAGQPVERAAADRSGGQSDAVAVQNAQRNLSAAQTVGEQRRGCRLGQQQRGFQAGQRLTAEPDFHGRQRGRQPGAAGPHQHPEQPDAGQRPGVGADRPERAEHGAGGSCVRPGEEPGRTAVGSAASHHRGKLAEDDAATATVELAKNQQTLLQSQQQVNQAQNSLDSAKASLQSTLAQNQQGLQSAKASLDQALNSRSRHRTPSTTTRSSRPARCNRHRASVDQASSQLNNAQATLQSTMASQASTLQNAQNTVAQNQSALKTQLATASQTLAPPTQATIDAANAQVANAQSGLQTALNNLQAATLVAPTDGTVAIAQRRRWAVARRWSDERVVDDHIVGVELQ